MLFTTDRINTYITLQQNVDFLLRMKKCVIYRGGSGYLSLLHLPFSKRGKTCYIVILYSWAPQLRSIMINFSGRETQDRNLFPHLYI